MLASTVYNFFFYIKALLQEFVIVLLEYSFQLKENKSLKKHNNKVRERIFFFFPCILFMIKMNLLLNLWASRKFSQNSHGWDGEWNSRINCRTFSEKLLLFVIFVFVLLKEYNTLFLDFRWIIKVGFVFLHYNYDRW